MSESPSKTGVSDNDTGRTFRHHGFMTNELAEAINRTVGYARVSTTDQNLARQHDALNPLCVRVFAEKISGKNAERPELKACLEYLRPGDVLVVTELSRLGRSLEDLVSIVGELGRRGIQFRSLKEAIDTSTPVGTFMFHIFAALAQFVRSIILEASAEGREAAKARGQHMGRPSKLTPAQVEEAATMLAHIPNATVASVATLLGVNRTTLIGLLKKREEIKTLCV